ncbi:hypothetical protein [Altericroceibacterium xinjiangense]|uniref:hypothetical protein n=1 Tax=Altericroceibacterium xinjiangense TaxID=762261 RepID=UPI000F7F9C12|nr:hypothetical protein [Altericroceibacterium xinjiangense]
MAFLDKFFVRRQGLPRFSALPQRVRQRLALAARELADAEAEMADQLGLSQPPRLLMIDEEEAVILSGPDREELY